MQNSNMPFRINGMQQVGIGVKNMYESADWYVKVLGMDIRIFEDRGEAALMTPHTGGKVFERNATLRMNLNGGAGIEVWQFESRDPQGPELAVQIGDYGVNIIQYKVKNLDAAVARIKADHKVDIKIVESPNGRKAAYASDPWGNAFRLIESNNWFMKPDNSHGGGVCGVLIGCSDIDASMKLYSDVLGYSNVVYDETGDFDDLKITQPDLGKARRVLLSKPQSNGAFSELFGEGEIELIQTLERTGNQIFKNRFWGDLGYIHLCFDISGLNALEEATSAAGFAFTVNSQESFEMTQAAGQFAYIEDPDGTLIEFVETHKVPVIEKLGLYLNLKPNRKELPRWMVKSLKFNKVKG